MMAVLLSLCATTLGQPPSPGVDLLGAVFKAGDANMSCFRIPSVVQTKAGTVSFQVFYGSLIRGFVDRPVFLGSG